MSSAQPDLLPLELRSGAKHRWQWLEPFVPKSIICLREGYGRAFLTRDILAGLTVGVIALPLSMALAIASGVGPERGLYAAIIAGFLISLLGGSRVQVGGPTGAFVIIIAGSVHRHGYDGLAIATIMAGLILIVMGLAAMLFMKRMSEVTNVAVVRREFDDSDAPLDNGDDPGRLDLPTIPSCVEVYEINGPFFFGVANRLADTLRGLERPPKVLVLRMRRVPAIDATGIHALEEFHLKCHRQGTRLLLAGVHAQPTIAMARYGLTDKIGEENLFGNIDQAKP